MGKKIFDRHNSEVIRSARELTLEDFLLKNNDTLASTEVLTKVYFSIRNNIKVAIQIQSGTTNNNEPVEAIHTLNNTEQMTKKTEPISIKLVENQEEVRAMLQRQKERKEEENSTEKKVNKTTKQDKIKLLIQSGATNKEIKLLLAEEDIKVYDSEILNARTKLNLKK